MKVKRYLKYDLNHISDASAAMAANIEDAYLIAGVNDYTAKECVDRALDVLLPQFGAGDDSYLPGGLGAEFNCSYPPEERRSLAV